MAKVATLVALLMLTTMAGARAQDNLVSCAVWMEANARMLARWQHSEPRCGWTVGGNTCVSRKHVTHHARATSVK
jgi:hypothetical protein